MHNKQHLRFIFLLWGWLLGLPVMAAASAPNILLIVADDLGWGDSQAWFANSDKYTPTLNQLAAGGVKFTRFYTDSTCSTSRAALLTGQHPTRLGFHPVARGIPSEIVTLPEYLQQQGYDTALMGKWHVGELYPQAKPNAQGFDYFFGYLNQWFLQGPAVDGSLKLAAPMYFDPWLTENDRAMQRVAGYLPEILTIKTEAWLSARAQQNTPWFLMYATPLPHGPLVAPPNSTATDKQAIYQAMVTRFDQDVARVIAALEKAGQRDNTLIIVLSDNGAPERLAGSNAGFAGGKWSYSEGAVRVPMLWIWPKNFQPATPINSDEIVFIADVFPSLVTYLRTWLKTEKFTQLRDGRDIFVEPPPTALNWMTRNSYSRVEGNKRFSGNWVYRTWVERQHERIEKTASHIEVITSEKAAAVESRFSDWLNDVSQTNLLKTGSGRYLGNDFLRTPLKEWDFYIALKPRLGAVKAVQYVAGQAGSWQLTWDGRELDFQLHGGQWQVRLPADAKCHVIGINADLYDRFTNISEDINLSRVTVTIDAIERLDAKWQISDLSNVDVTAPLIIGNTNDADKVAWQGRLSEPLLFHRANRAGEWAFLLDEKAIYKQLCAQLEE